MGAEPLSAIESVVMACPNCHADLPVTVYWRGGTGQWECSSCFGRYEIGREDVQ